VSWTGPRVRAVVALALSICVVSATGALAAGPPVPKPFRGTALWVNQLAPGGSGVELAARAAAAGVRTLYVKAADGATPELQFSPVLVAEARAAGATLCAWTFAYGQNPIGEAAAAVAAVRAGAQCLVVDAEAEYDSLYGAAQAFVAVLRAQLGAAFPIGLASEAEVSEHPKFPYSVFLGPGAFNVVLPQIYWRDFGVSVDAAFAATIGANSIYGRAILPLGQLYGGPAPAEVTRFRALALAYDALGSSFFDLDDAQPEALSALGAPLPAPARMKATPPTLHAGADGDEVVWAQELLNAAGAHLPVGGFLGAQTAQALAHFQRRHHLHASEVLGPATWKALMRLRPHEPSFATAPPDSAL
jgi:peptidoglycan hydrolase-like protein with peptidoglycan-binding domain